VFGSPLYRQKRNSTNILIKKNSPLQTLNQEVSRRSIDICEARRICIVVDHLLALFWGQNLFQKNVESLSLLEDVSPENLQTIVHRQGWPLFQLRGARCDEAFMETSVVQTGKLSAAAVCTEAVRV
jgi:hypothetical protein